MNRKTAVTLAFILVPLALVAGCAFSLPDRVTQPMFTSALRLGESRQDVRTVAKRLGKTVNTLGAQPDANDDAFQFGTLNLLVILQRNEVVAHFGTAGRLERWTVTPTSAAM